MPELRTELTDPLDTDEALSDRERELLQVLGQVGAATPMELAVKTFSLPEEISSSLEKLQQKQLIEVKRSPGKLAGDLVVISKRGLRLAQMK